MPFACQIIFQCPPTVKSVKNACNYKQNAKYNVNVKPYVANRLSVNFPYCIVW